MTQHPLSAEFFLLVFLVFIAFLCFLAFFFQILYYDMITMRDFIEKLDKTIEAFILNICYKNKCNRGFTEKRLFGRIEK